MQKGNIFTTCPECGNQFRVEVIFPSFNKGFEDIITNCPDCNTELKVTDNHKYTEDGTIYTLSSMNI